MEILKFEPFLRTMVWGGDKIARYKGISTDVPSIGESWEISGYREHETAVKEGRFAGRTVNSLVKEFGAALVGRKVYETYGNEFPLLIKFIDAASDLSIQVHPDDAFAAAHHGPDAKGKTEMWYVLGADPGAYLYSGLSAKLDPESYAAHIADDSITDVLARHDIAPGDVFFLPAGRIHAICAGSFIVEIQQTSDLTYRIYDYGRLGLDGKPRPLHTDLAKDAIDYKVYDDYRTRYKAAKDADVPLVDCRYFHTSMLDLEKEFDQDLSGLDSFEILICIGGEGELHGVEDGKSLPICRMRQGETVLVPSSITGLKIVPGKKGMRLLTTHC